MFSQRVTRVDGVGDVQKHAIYNIQCYRTAINKHTGTEVSVSYDDDHVTVISLCPVHNGTALVQIRFDTSSLLCALAGLVYVEALTKAMQKFIVTELRQ